MKHLKILSLPLLFLFILISCESNDTSSTEELIITEELSCEDCIISGDSFSYTSRSNSIEITKNHLTNCKFDDNTLKANVVYYEEEKIKDSISISYSLDLNVLKIEDLIPDTEYIIEIQISSNDCQLFNDKVNLTTNSILNVFLIGDSTCSDYASKYSPRVGWGTKLKGLINGTEVINNALSGRSSKSFYNESDAWPKTIAEVKENDYVFIQFGHNDQKIEDELRGTLPYTTYQEYLLKYLDEVRAKKAYPVLITSINRNVWKDDQITNSLGSYPDAMKELAEEENVPLVDLNLLTKDLFETKGKDYTTYSIFLNLQPNEYENYPDGSTDNSHLQDNGGQIIAEAFLKEIMELKSTYPTIEKLLNN